MPFCFKCAVGLQNVQSFLNTLQHCHETDTVDFNVSLLACQGQGTRFYVDERGVHSVANGVATGTKGIVTSNRQTGGDRRVGIDYAN